MATVEPQEGLNIDTGLLRLVAKRDEASLRRFYESNCDQLFAFVARRTKGSIEDAEEITNDTFLSACSLANTYDGSCSVLTWLCSIAQHRIIDFRRKTTAAKRIPEENFVRIDDETKRILRSVHDPNASLEDLAEKLDRARVVQALLDTLTQDQREALTMRYIEGFSVSEIARIMKRSTKAVEKLLERAKEKPRREMLHWLGDEGFALLCFEVLIL